MNCFGRPKPARAAPGEIGRYLFSTNIRGLGSKLRAADAAQALAEGLEVIHYAVSLGHHRSLIYWIGTDDVVGSPFTLEGAQLDAYRAFAGDGVFRFSVGLEDPEDLCADLERVL